MGEQLLPCGHPAECDGLAGEGGDQPGCGWCADLIDLSMLTDHLSRTYMHFSRGRISKPNTLPEEVFSVASDAQEEETQKAIEEALRDAAPPRSWFYTSERLPKPGEFVGRFWVALFEGKATPIDGFWHPARGVFVSHDGRQEYRPSPGEAYAWEPLPDAPPLPNSPREDKP